MVSNASKIFTKLKSDAIKEGLDEGRKEGIKDLPEETIDLIAIDIFDLKRVEDLNKYL